MTIKLDKIISEKRLAEWQKMSDQDFVNRLNFYKDATLKPMPFKSENVARAAVLQWIENGDIEAMALLKRFVNDKPLTENQENKITFLSVEFNGKVYRIAKRTKHGIELNPNIFYT